MFDAGELANVLTVYWISEARCLILSALLAWKMTMFLGAGELLNDLSNWRARWRHHGRILLTTSHEWPRRSDLRIHERLIMKDGELHRFGRKNSLLDACCAAISHRTILATDAHGIGSLSFEFRRVVVSSRLLLSLRRQCRTGVAHHAWLWRLHWKLRSWGILMLSLWQLWLHDSHLIRKMRTLRPLKALVNLDGSRCLWKFHLVMFVRGRTIYAYRAFEAR